MNWLEYLKAVVMGTVEGITEFLPISSTGHLIIAGHVIDFSGPMAENFEIVIQLGAILAVCWLYRDRLLRVAQGLRSDTSAQRFVLNLLVAFIPAAVIGLLLHHQIKALLFNPVTVAIALIVGGFAILLVERLHISVRTNDIDELKLTDAFKIGCVQILALIPGTSRSGATIIGGLLCGLSRTAATEFSFFLAIPVMFAATGLDLVKSAGSFTSDYAIVLAIGFITAFITAVLAVKTFIRYVSGHDFTAFAIYRVVFGALCLWHYWPK
ncbi:MAG: undecaprenyl-diphosphate phosphatase [Gammaproteobacteria bacterium]